MSKNVAVFVDVANIFYAAKAAGVDIDYVTLLKSASAGRDLVRAYAYTGLDPENENQRQFHSFLSRSGYKVVSKDIRKYGDGRIKANLDIELVVDMMRMATHLDIAVVISGDGDFAPAIRAVQQMGVRVEVISFRGNTSSDLIEVADVFIDITQVARVEKGVRSGRRVAAEGDLSMTEVPDKETEGAARRRRTPRRVPERERAAAVAPVAVLAVVADADVLPGNIIVLPGERLSKVAPGDEERDTGEQDTGEQDTGEQDTGEQDTGEQDTGEQDTGEQDVALGEAPGASAADGDMETDADGRRRRRRRGGRGRGRGRREEGQPAAETQVTALEPPVMIQPAGVPDLADVSEMSDDDEEFLDEVPVAIPQHSTFGAVWDTQLGVPSAPMTATPLAEDEEDLDEPEIPEYLLAERRQQQQRNRGGRGGGGVNRGGRGGGAYRTALDRERFGRSGVSSFGGGGAAAGNMGSNMSRPPDRQRGRDQRPQAPNRQGRPPLREGAPQQAPRSPQQSPRSPQQSPRPPQQADRPSQEAEPWSEVPAEVQALLRAELARRSSRPAVPSEPQARSEDEARSESEAPREAQDQREDQAPPEAVEPPAVDATEAAEPPVATPPRKRAPRTASRAKAGVSSTEPDAPEAVEADVEKAPSRPRATRARRAATTQPEPAQAAAAEEPAAATEEPAAAAPAAKRRTTRKAGLAASEGAPPEGEAAAATEAAMPTEEPPKPRRRTTRKSAAGPSEGGSGAAEEPGASEG